MYLKLISKHQQQNARNKTFISFLPKKFRLNPINVFIKEKDILLNLYIIPPFMFTELSGHYDLAKLNAN